MKIEKYEVFTWKVPLRMRVMHAQAIYSYSNNVFVKVSSGEHVGWGECVPRDFLLHKGMDAFLEEMKGLRIEGEEFGSFEEAVDFCTEMKAPECGGCAVELAILDLAGKFFNKPVHQLINSQPHDVVYSAVIPTNSVQMTRLLTYVVRFYRMKQVKVKVGLANDLARVKAVRSLLGDADIRVDANCAWGVAKAVDMLRQLRPFISSVEQPTPAANLKAMREVKEMTNVPIIADESLCTIEDAKALIKSKACDIFNIRLSKCGGLIKALEIYGLAQKNKIPCMLGCQVGETGILSAAGRQFAQCLDLLHVEGSYDKWLLKKNITSDVSFGKGGIAKPITGPGLGISVDDTIFNL